MVRSAPLRDAPAREAWLHEHGFVLHGRTIPTALRPVVLTPAQEGLIGTAAEALLRVLGRFGDAYARDERLRDELRLDPLEDELVRLDPGYATPVQVARLDAVLRGGRLRFVEVNGDSPGSMAFTDIAHRALQLASPDGFGTHAPFRYAPMVPAVASALLAVHRDARRTRPELPASPRVALVDIAGTPTAHDIGAVTRELRSRGIDAVEATPETLAYDGERLRADGQPLDLVYRRVLVDQLGDGDLTRAARDGSVIVVNAFRGRVANNKKTLALLDDPRFAYLIRPEEACVVSATIPWTRILRPGSARRGRGVVELPAFAISNRERLVIKPASGYGGSGVRIGPEVDQSAWEDAVRAACELEDHVVQELVSPPVARFSVLEDARVEIRTLRLNLSPFVIGGRHAGTMARIAPGMMVNLTAGGALLPCVVRA